MTNVRLKNNAQIQKLLCKGISKVQKSYKIVLKKFCESLPLIKLVFEVLEVKIKRWSCSIRCDLNLLITVCLPLYSLFILFTGS